MAIYDKAVNFVTSNPQGTKDMMKWLLLVLGINKALNMGKGAAEHIYQGKTQNAMMDFELAKANMERVGRAKADAEQKDFYKSMMAQAMEQTQENREYYSNQDSKERQHEMLMTLMQAMMARNTQQLNSIVPPSPAADRISLFRMMGG